MFLQSQFALMFVTRNSSILFSTRPLGCETRYTARSCALQRWEPVGITTEVYTYIHTWFLFCLLLLSFFDSLFCLLHC